MVSYKSWISHNRQCGWDKLYDDCGSECVFVCVKVCGECDQLHENVQIVPVNVCVCV